MNQELKKFLQQHPEYFERSNDGHFIASNLRSMVDAYALAMDAKDYESLRVKVADFRAKEDAKLKQEVEFLNQKLEKEKAIYNEVMQELADSEKKLSEMEAELGQVIAMKKSKPGSKNSGKRGGYLYLVLYFVGILLLYIGFILSDRPVFVYVVAGMACFVAGLMFSPRGRGSKSTVSPIVTRVSDQLQDRNDRIKRVWDVKKQLLYDRKKLALSKINECDSIIQEKLSHMHGK
ncbi:MAG: hypothetical protein ACPGF8_04840 [Opitutales bacterium]